MFFPHDMPTKKETHAKNPAHPPRVLRSPIDRKSPTSQSVSRARHSAASASPQRRSLDNGAFTSVPSVYDEEKKRKHRLSPVSSVCPPHHVSTMYASKKVVAYNKTIRIASMPWYLCPDDAITTDSSAMQGRQERIFARTEEKCCYSAPTPNLLIWKRVNKAGSVDTLKGMYNLPLETITTNCIRSNRLVDAVYVPHQCRSSFQNFVYVETSPLAGIGRIGSCFSARGRRATAHASVFTKVLRQRRS